MREQTVDELELRLVPLISLSLSLTHTHTHTAQLQNSLLGSSQGASLGLTGVECPLETSMHFPAPYGASQVHLCRTAGGFPRAQVGCIFKGKPD